MRSGRSDDVDATFALAVACLFLVAAFVHAYEMSIPCHHGPDCPVCTREWRDKQIK